MVGTGYADGESESDGKRYRYAYCVCRFFKAPHIYGEKIKNRLTEILTGKILIVMKLWHNIVVEIIDEDSSQGRPMV